MSTAIIPIEHDELTLGEPHGVQLTKTGLTFSRAVSLEEWADFGQQLKKIGGAIQWWIGDWLNYGEKAYGEKYTEALAVTGYEYQSLVDMKTVSKKVEFTLRNVNLSMNEFSKCSHGVYNPFGEATSEYCSLCNSILVSPDEVTVKKVRSSVGPIVILTRTISELSDFPISK